MNMAEQSSLIEYPCDFPIKIMGRADSLLAKPALAAAMRLRPCQPSDERGALHRVGGKRAVAPPSASDSSTNAVSAGLKQPGFAQAMLAIVKRHAPDFDDATMEMKASKKGAYLSLTCTVRATSRIQLDALYQELCDHPMVVMVL